MERKEEKEARTASPTELLGRAAALAAAIAAASAAVLRDFVRRDDIVRAVWLALVSDSAAFFLGPPGVAKTATVQRLSKEIEGCVFFEALMPAIVSAEQLFVESTSIEEQLLADGAKSIAVKQTLGRAANAHIFFADEIWKAEPMVLQPLLDLARADGVRHEGAFHDTPIMAFLAASNELPEDGSRLGAMWSRMIIRVDVRGLDRSGRKVMIESRLRQQRGQTATNAAAQMSVEDIQLLQRARPFIELPVPIVEIVLEIIEELCKKDAEGFRWLAEDDRRFGFVCDVLQANALIHERAAVSKQDLGVLEWMLWNTTEQIGVIRGVLAPYIRTPLSEAREMLDALLASSGLVDGYLNGANSKAADALAAIKECLTEIEGKKSAVSGAELPALEAIVGEVKSLRQRVVNKAAGITA